MFIIVLFSTNTFASYQYFSKSAFMSDLQDIQYEEIVNTCGIGEVFDVIHLTPTDFDIKTDFKLDKFTSLKCQNKIDIVLKKHDRFVYNLEHYKRYFSPEDAIYFYEFIDLYTVSLLHKKQLYKLLTLLQKSKLK